MDWYRAIVKQIWRNCTENTHPCSHGEMVRWWNGLIQSYGEMSTVKWCIEYTPMFTWWNGDLVKWCGANNNKVKWCNGETIITTFGSYWFLGPLQQWGPIPLLHFIIFCITRWLKSRIWMILRWLYKRPMSRCNAFWCRIPLILSDWFLLLILFLIPPTTANTRGDLTIWHLHVFCHYLLYLYWKYITICQSFLYYCTQHTLHIDAIVIT